MEWPLAESWRDRCVGFHSLCNLFGGENTLCGGLLTVLLFVAIVLSGEFAIQDYRNTHSAYLTTLEQSTTPAQITVVCNALYCAFDSSSIGNLTNGSSALLNASAALSYTVQVVVPSSDFELRWQALAFSNNGSLQYFDNLEQEALKAVLLSKTIDETKLRESWTAQVSPMFRHYLPCVGFPPELICGAYSLDFENTVYVISWDLRSSVVIVLSAAMISSVTLGVLIFLTYWCISARTQVQIYFANIKKDV